MKLCSLCGSTTWWQRVVCAGSVDGPWRWLSNAHLLGRCTCGVRGGVGVSTSGLQHAALCCSLRIGADWGVQVWTLGPLALGLRIPPPSLQAAGTKGAAKPPGLSRFSQNPAFTLPASEFPWFCFLPQTVVLKIANMRNHREADS